MSQRSGAALQTYCGGPRNWNEILRLFNMTMQCKLLIEQRDTNLNQLFVEEKEEEDDDEIT